MKVIVILMTSIFLLQYFIWAGFVYAEDADRKETVKIFVGGKGYNGLTDYRRHKIITKVKKFVSEHNKLKFSALFRMLRQKISSIDIDYLGGDDDFLVIVRNFYNEYHKEESNQSVSDDKRFIEMKHMLDDYLKSHKTAVPIELDPNKIKTVIISPKKKTVPNEDFSK